MFFDKMKCCENPIIQIKVRKMPGICLYVVLCFLKYEIVYLFTCSVGDIRLFEVAHRLWITSWLEKYYAFFFILHKLNTYKSVKRYTYTQHIAMDTLYYILHYSQLIYTTNWFLLCFYGTFWIVWRVNI